MGVPQGVLMGGIHGVAIPHELNVVPRPSEQQPFGQHAFSPWTALRPRAKALRALAPRPRLVQDEKSLLRRTF